jgi:hypothetical protein
MSDTSTTKDSRRRLRDRLVAAAVIARYINELAVERAQAPAPAPSS